MGALDGKVAVITGAGSGMAKASVRVFVREGAKVVAGDLSGAEKVTAAEVGESVIPVHCDVRVERDVEALVDAALEQFGRLDVLLNVAGVGGAEFFPRGDGRGLRQKMDVNLRGVFFGMKFGARAMLRSGGGPSSIGRP